LQKHPPSAEKNALAEVQKEMLHSQLDDIVDLPMRTAKSCGACGIVKAEVTVD
jgi:hypothetical protein